MADGTLTNHHQTHRGQHDDLFANFSYNPPKPVGHFRSFSHRSRYKAMNCLPASREQLGSNTSMASLSGSTQNLLDPAKMMSMQDDARSRRISSEVMKHCLYESVVSPYHRRRLSMRPDYRSSTHLDVDSASGSYSRSMMVQSLPVTPAQSQTVTPLHSPTGIKRFRAFLSHRTTPRNSTPDDDVDSLEVEEDSWKGLASLFRPQPRYIPAVAGGVSKMEDDDLSEAMELGVTGDDGGMITLDPPPRGHKYRSKYAS